MLHIDRTDSQVDPLLSEQRRAQRRLIGALILILGAVILLPIVLDSQPQPAPHSITIEIPKSLFETCKKRAARAQKGTASHLSDQPALDALCDDSESRFESAHSTVTLPQPAPTAARPLPSNQVDVEQALNRPSVRPRIAGAPFFIHLSRFSSKAQADIWMQKLKAAGFSASLEREKTLVNATKNQQTSINGALTIRIGPFEDRIHAQYALDTIENMGVKSTIR